jgi:2-amino-4-hydroxy-6-hydroxymethyldihydropteridine diphosphokinase
LAARIVLNAKRVYLGLGSNLGDRELSLRNAIHKLHQPDFRILRISSVFETEALLFAAQADFLNCVIEAETEVMPLRLLQRIQRIEREMGRKRTIAKGPRNIDIDILLFGRSVIATSDLQIPHPGMAERRFVLEPLAELAPMLRHPVYQKTVRDLLVSAPDQRLVRVDLRLDIPLLPGREE